MGLGEEVNLPVLVTGTSVRGCAQVGGWEMRGSRMRGPGKDESLGRWSEGYNESSIGFARVAEKSENFCRFFLPSRPQ